METIDYKNILKEFREEISKLEKEQKIIKPQRKTVHYTGERTISPSEAIDKARLNSYSLRCMYAAYNLLRGKGFDITEKNAKPLNAKDYYERTGCSLDWELERTGCGLDKELDGKHPLFLDIDEINSCLVKYGFKIPLHEEEKKTNWGTYKKRVFEYENYEKIVCNGE